MEEVMLKWLVVIRRPAIKRKRIILLEHLSLSTFCFARELSPIHCFGVVALHSVLSWPRYVIVEQ
jgi:hypothetical protein